ncbi:SRPBCC family protein [Streptomyces sp. NPDC059459]|uniref:SRPBCC family protein n=1 Tax=unclassified Streptomyces TaxID=2593676 RepID=UPI0036B95ED6
MVHLQVDYETSCEHCSISREIRIEAPPRVVYDVVSRPEHLREWWPDEAGLATSTPGSTGTGALRARPAGQGRSTDRGGGRPPWRPERNYGRGVRSPLCDCCDAKTVSFVVRRMSRL